MPNRLGQFICGVLFLLFSIALNLVYGWHPIYLLGIAVSCMEMICAYGTCGFCTIAINFIAQLLVIWYGIGLMQVSDMVPVLIAFGLLTASYARNYFYAFRRRHN